MIILFILAFQEVGSYVIIIDDCVMRNINYCPFCGEKLDK